MIETAIARVVRGEDLTLEEMQQAVDTIMRGEASDTQIACLITGLHFKGESMDEIAGAAGALRAHMSPIRTRHERFIDTCGTGGDKSGTFNISTAAAIVTAAAGLPVAKHGNRAVTSKSGSADVLTELGVNVQADLKTVSACLDELGICFCFAPLYHGSMKHAAAVRKRLRIPTIFNYIGPLSNPASAPFQLIGVARPELRESMAGAMSRLDHGKGAVVWAEAGLDEVASAGVTQVSLVEGGVVREESWRPEDFGLAPAAIEELKVNSASESAAVIRKVLAGEQTAARTIVVMNAAAALWVAGNVGSLSDGAQQAAAAIDSGAAETLLERLKDRTQA